MEPYTHLLVTISERSSLLRTPGSDLYGTRTSFNFPLKVKWIQIDKWTTNLLPSRQFGYVVLTTSDGIIDHEEAKKKHTGGKILGFFF